jgi:hypothetical protein
MQSISNSTKEKITAVTKEYINSCLENINERVLSRTLISYLNIFDVRYLSKDEISLNTYGEESIKQLYNLFWEKMPNITEEMALIEWKKAKQRLSSFEFSLLTNAKEVRKVIIKTGRFSNLLFTNMLVRIAITIAMLPSTSTTINSV